MVKLIIFAIGLIAFCNQFDNTFGCGGQSPGFPSAARGSGQIVPRKMPTRDQVKALISNPKVQDRIIDMLNELLKMTEKPKNPCEKFGIPIEMCDRWPRGPKANE